MTRLLTNTNIMVDDFDFCKSFPKDTFIHFLTHFHTDHYQGITSLWNYGEIHCTHQTKKYLINKFPKLTRVFSYDYYVPYTITISKQLRPVQFMFFDAKHIPGAAMIFFKGYMGSILFTGDFRYDYSMVKENAYFFPSRLRNGIEKQDQVQKMNGISLKVDEMIFDNTYCNSQFKFETEPYIVQKMIGIIQKNKDKQLVYVAMGALGKHRILMKLAEYFQTSIVVSQKQFNKIALANLRTDFLTTNVQQGFIHLISKKNRAQIVQNTKKGSFGDNFICIDTDFLMLDHQSPDQINYIVPYSLHSNYQQMQTFIRMIQPCILRKIVIPYANFRQVKLRIKIDNRVKFAKYLDYLQYSMDHSVSGFSYLVKNYTCIQALSKEYLKWFSPQLQQKLMNLLKIYEGVQNHNLRKRKPILLTEEQMQNQSSLGSKKTSLKDIADSLNAVNKNETIQQAFQKQKEKKSQQKFNQIFYREYSQTDKTQSNTCTLQTKPSLQQQQIVK